MTGDAILAGYFLLHDGHEYVVGDVAREALDALCLARIARFKRPKHYVFVDALPKNNYGKILKTELRARDAAPVKG